MAQAKKRSKGVGKFKTNKELLAEIETLNQQIIDLKKGAKVKKTKRSFNWRKFFAFSSLAIAIASFTVFNLSFWLNETIINNEQFAQTVSPIIKDKEVQKTLSNEITKTILSKIDLEQNLKNNLPENIQFIAGPLSTQVEEFINKKVVEVISASKTQDAWNKVVINTHNVVVGYVQDPNSTGTINVDQVYQAASKELKDSPIGFLFGKDLPDSIGNVNVVTIKWFPQARAYLDALKKVNILLLFSTVIFTLLALVSSKRKLKMFIIMSAYTFVVMVATLIAIQVLISQGSLQVAQQYQAALKSIITIVTQPLINQTLGFVGLSGSVIVFALISSKFGWALALRNGYRKCNDFVFSKIFNNAKKGSPNWINWLSQQRLVIVWTLAGIFYAIFALRMPPNIEGVYDAFISTAIVVIILEAISSINRVLNKHPKKYKVL